MKAKSMNFLVFICCIFYITTTHSGSILIKTQEYSFMNYPRVEGLSYPEEIEYVDSSFSTAFFFTNITSGKTWTNISIVKTMSSSCVWGLVTLDYGYYTKFPYYELVGDCRNTTAKVLYTIKLYRSGEHQFIPGDIQILDDVEKSCQLGKLKVQSYYSSSGQKNMGAYRYCRNPLNKTGGSVLYKYTPSAKKMQTINEITLENTLRLPANFQTIDVLPYLGEFGDFTAVISPYYNLTISNGKIQTNYPLPIKQKSLRLTKLCWQDQIALLTQNYIFSFRINYQNTSITIQNTNIFIINKLFPIESCNFFSIGKFVICSFNNQNLTTWYWYNYTASRYQFVQRFSTLIDQPSIQENFCSTSSFYIKNSRYSFLQSPSGSQLQTYEKKEKFVKQFVTASKNIVSFGDIRGSWVLFVQLIPVSQALQQIRFFVRNYSSSFFQVSTSTNPSQIRVQIEQINAQNPKFTVIYPDYSTGKTIVQSCLFNYDYGRIDFLKNASMDGIVKNFALLQPSLRTYVGYTPIQLNTIALLTGNGTTFNLNYTYEFEAAKFQICTIQYNQLLLFRMDPEGLVVIRSGFRRGHTLILDDIRVFKQYLGYTFKCTHDGILGHNSKKSSIIQIDKFWAFKQYGPLKFSDMKFTKTSLLLKNEDKVNIYQKGQKIIAISQNWNLDAILTDIHSGGFFSKQDNTYYNIPIEYEQNQNPKNLQKQ